ncbi:MAG: menaquinone biosynthesis protein [Pirellulales bacterium]
MRIGAVNYLNSKPLVHGLEELAPDAQIVYDLPSRLADSLSAGRLDVALIPSIELFRGTDYAIVSDACVACRGPVLSVKLHFRVPPKKVRTVALDEGSRTSSALTQILLAELFGITPRWEPLPIGSGVQNTNADAVLLIGDRAITSGEQGAGSREPSRSTLCEVWDLGEQWCNWTGLPFVFAMWIAHAGVDVSQIAPILGAARDNGRCHLAAIAAREAPALDISPELAMRYFRDNLHFTLGPQEREGLSRFYQLCVDYGLAPRGRNRMLEPSYSNGCATK